MPGLLELAAREMGGMVMTQSPELVDSEQYIVVRIAQTAGSPCY